MRLKIQCQYLSVSVFFFWKASLRCMRTAYRSAAESFKGFMHNFKQVESQAGTKLM